MTTFDGLSKTQRIRATLHRDVRSICAETCHFLGLEITKPAMEIIAELVFKKITLYGLDLEAFAKHAKRATINSEDVKLLVRRNPSLKNHLNSIAPAPSSVTKDKRRKTVALPALRQETPAKTNDPVVSPRIQEAPTDSNEGTTSRVEQPPAKTKDVAKQDDFEDMLIDDTIDLTFD